MEGHTMDKKIEILIVDDEIAIREDIGFLLKDKYAVATAAGVEEALYYMSDNHVDLVLLDIKMPKRNGITVFREIMKRYPETQVIFMTAHSTPEISQDTLIHDAYGFIMKPFYSEDLVRFVDEARKDSGRFKS